MKSVENASLGHLYRKSWTTRTAIVGYPKLLTDTFALEDAFNDDLRRSNGEILWDALQVLGFMYVGRGIVLLSAIAVAQMSLGTEGSWALSAILSTWLVASHLSCAVGVFLVGVFGARFPERPTLAAYRMILPVGVVIGVLTVFLSFA